MLPLTPVCVPNIYKRVDLRCAHRFWEVLELLTRIKTTSYGTCCAVSPTSHAQWVFLARSSTSLTLSRWFFILLRVTETFPQDAFFSPLRISMYSYVKYSSNRQQLCKLVHSHRVVFNATERNGLIFTQPWVAQCPRILREVKLAWQGWGAAEQASFPLGTQKKEPHPNGETCAWAETHSPPPHIYPRLPSSGPVKHPKSPSQKEAGPSPPPSPGVSLQARGGRAGPARISRQVEQETKFRLSPFPGCLVLFRLFGFGFLLFWWWCYQPPSPSSPFPLSPHP